MTPPHPVRRTAGVLRRALREPDRRRRLRRDLGKVWRPATPAAAVQPVARLVDDASVREPRRDVRALLIAEPALAVDLAYEWRQSTAPNGSLDDIDLLVVSTAALLDGPWATGDAASRALAGAVERHLPIVVWDTAEVDAVARLAQTLGPVTAVRTVDPTRVTAWQQALPGIPVDALLPGVQQRRYSPVDAERPPTVGLVVDGPGAPDEALQPILRAAESLGLSLFGEPASLTGYPRKVASRLVGPADDDVLRSAFRSNSAWFVPTSGEDVLQRALQLAASQTPFVTGPSSTVAAAFGDLAPGATPSDTAVAEASRSLRAYVRQPELRDRVGLQLQRHALSAHTSGHRVEALLTDAGLGRVSTPRRVSVVVPTNRPGQLEHVLEFVGRQDYASVQLVLVLHGLDADAGLADRARDAGVDELVVVQAPADVTLGACMNLGVDACDGDVIAKMDDDNLYGTAYLTDLVQAFDYTDAGVVGKLAHYVHLASSQAVLLRGAEHEHRYVRLVQGGSMVMDGDLVREARFEDVPRAVDTTFLDKVGARGVRVYSADRFNYVSVRRSDATSHTWQVSDLEILSTKDAQLCFYGDPWTHINV